MSTGSVLKKYQSHIQYRLKKENKMQLRAVMLVDLDVENFQEAAVAELMLQKDLDDLQEKYKYVTYVALDVKERRGASKPDIKNMKFRQNK